MRVLIVLGILWCASSCLGQTSSVKIHHAEPLYMDLIRDLGARKGEREWNVGGGINRHHSFVSYSGFIEYEFSPVHRLGLEVEIPFSFYQPINVETASEETPRHRMEGLKAATQYTFWVSSRYRLSMAAGYMNELKLHSFITMSDRQEVIKGNAYSPFLIVAKRWGVNFHTMLYGGPLWEHEFKTGNVESFFQFNSSIHYMIRGTSHFIGLECNQEISFDVSELVLRPQAKMKVSSSVFLGMLMGIPVHSKDQQMSFMLRVIYEPKKKSKQ